MKVALLTADFPPIEGGLSRLSTDLAYHFDRMGRLSGVLVPRLAGSEDFYRNLTYPVTRVPGYNWGIARFIPGFLSSAAFRKTVLPETDRILAINPSFGGAYGAALNCLGEATPFSVFAYGYEFLKFQIPRPRWGKKILDFIYRKATSVIAISQFTRDRLIGFGVSPDRIEVCYLGVDVETFCPESEPGAARESLEVQAEGPILLTVGRLVSRKKHHLVLETIRDLKKDWPGIIYWIVGRGPEEPRLREFVAREGLERNVRFWGKMHDSQLPLLYQACDLFLLPAVQEGPSVEGLGLVLQEAAACGKPVIGASSGGIPEAMVPGTTGALVSPGDKDELGEAIQGLLADSEKMEAMGRAGREWVSKEKDWRICAKRIVDALSS